MKKILFILISIMIFACKSQKTIYSPNDNYNITKIDSINDYYVVYAKKDNKNHKIISKKNTSKCKNKLVVGKNYCLKTESIFVFKIKDNDSVRVISNNVNIDCMILDNTKICKEYNLGIFDVLKSKNLNGLCFEDKIDNVPAGATKTNTHR